MSNPIRRIVTGVKAGKSIISQDAAVPALFEAVGVCWTEVWKTDGAPAKLGSERDPVQDAPKLEPPRNGTIIRFVEFLPSQGKPPADPAEIERQVAELFAGVGAAHCHIRGGRHPTMHRTKTIDYGLLLTGQITLILDEGEVTLQPSDIVIQRGTAHSWENRGATPALMAFVLVDAE